MKRRWREHHGDFLTGRMDGRYTGGIVKPRTGPKGPYYLVDAWSGGKRMGEGQYLALVFAKQAVEHWLELRRRAAVRKSVRAAKRSKKR